ncbi:MAG: acetate/propionate family kinase [Terriglobales bacterium]
MRVLCVNTGSSSVKWARFDGGRRQSAGRTEGLREAAAFAAAMDRALGEQTEEPQAVAHRIVAPATAWAGARRMDDGLKAELRALTPLAPDHLPQALAAIAAAEQHFPALPQWACSDSSFHRTLPAPARRLPLPPALDPRLARYGYHGLSCESVVEALRSEGALPRRMVIAHLGNGCSLTAVRDGASVETTMGFTPLGGLVMSTRAGDLDPGVLLYLLQERGVQAAQLNQILNHEAGLRGLAGGSGDMKALLADPRPEAAAAVELFVYTARKYLGAMAAVLGGVDVLVFTGGIGEHAAGIRGRMIQGMDWLAPGGTLSTRVIPAGEEGVMARQTAAAMGG